jgi:hypothetical protein
MRGFASRRKSFSFKKFFTGHWWLTPVPRRQKSGGSQFKATPGNSSRDPISKIKL